jgi:hypothetical protein
MEIAADCPGRALMMRPPPQGRFYKEKKMNTTLLTVVKQIIAEQGEAILTEPKRLKGWVSDYAKGEPKAERLALGRCIEYGAYAELKGVPAADRAAVKARLARKLHNEEGLDTAL